ncbi:MAG: hypothetical protein O7F12_00235 [Nitrospirae bacterium]|nr:hypothetical protein [Nitrospirota bacterium]
MTQPAIVTGGGSGLGASFVRKLAQEGCRAGMFARSEGYTLNQLDKEGRVG